MNISAKKIDAVMFKVDSVGALGDIQQLVVTPEYTILENQKRHPFNPGVVSKIGFENNPVLSRGGYRVYLYGARYEDGSIWKDDGSHSCSLKTEW